MKFHQRDILYSTWPALLKIVKVIKNKNSQHQGEPKET